MSEDDLGFRESTVVVATRDQVSCELGEEAAILGMKNSVYYGLNPVGARIWRLLQEPRSIEEIRGVIVNEYDVSHERAGSDLLKLLAQMWEEGLVEIKAGTNSKAGLNRS